MTAKANGNQIMWVITFGFCPVENMVDVHLNDTTLQSSAKTAAVIIAPLDQLANSAPTFPSILFASIFPRWALVSGSAIHRIACTSSGFEFLHSFFAKFARWVDVRMFVTVYAITNHIAKLAGCVRSFADIDFSAIEAGHLNCVSRFTEFASTLYRTGQRFVAISVHLIKIPLGDCSLVSTLSAGISDIWHNKSLPTKANRQLDSLGESPLSVSGFSVRFSKPRLSPGIL